MSILDISKYTKDMGYSNFVQKALSTLPVVSPVLILALVVSGVLVVMIVPVGPGPPGPEDMSKEVIICGPNLIALNRR